MTDDMSPAIARLQARLEEQLSHVKKTKAALNALHEAFDRPIPYPDIDEDRVVRTTIRRGMFYGQPLATCVRQILEMRRAAQLDAASVSEIYTSLREGGYAFETKDDENAKNGLRQSLRKNPIFHRIPSGEWGLMSWYPNAKADRSERESDGDDEDGPSGRRNGGTDASAAEADTKAKKKKDKPGGIAVPDEPPVPRTDEQAVSAN